MMKKRAVVLLSGGLDSATCTAIAISEGFQVYPLTMVYGQRNAKEVACAQAIAKYYNVSKYHHIIPLPLWFHKDAGYLTHPVDVPFNFDKVDNEALDYLPARNLVFFSCAVAYAEMIKAPMIYVGVSSLDYDHYPDCRPEFINAFQDIVKESTKAGQQGQAPIMRTPLLRCSTAETIAWGLQLKVPYELTISCYQGFDKACGKCDRCCLRRIGFLECGFEDPIPYLASPSVSLHI